MLTEAEVQRSFRKLFENSEVTGDKLDKAEDMLDQLRPESPLLHRLQQEVDEMRELVGTSS